MCGGTLEISENMTVCECDYCGTTQTLPKSDNEQTLNMFNRANHFRQQCEFDKAAAIYERMTAQSDDAELYWSIILCRYGIEYVEDPVSHESTPISPSAIPITIARNVGERTAFFMSFLKSGSSPSAACMSGIAIRKRKTV